MVSFLHKFLAMMPLLVLSNAQPACPGICLYWGDVVLNAATEVTIGNTTNTCEYFDQENSGHNDSDRCLQFADDALDAGCRCGIPSVCPGICHGKDHILLNAETTVSVQKQGGPMETCTELNLQAQEIIDARGCDEMAEKAEGAGCICGLPIECTGICLVEGESMLNADARVEFEGKQARCDSLDTQATTLIGDKICAINADKVKAAGCKCGVPMNCPGICTEPGESLLNEFDEVTIDGKTNDCSYFNSLADNVIDGEVCEEMSIKAVAAGCKCGVAIECPGICLNENESLLNSEVDVAVGGLGGTCDFFDRRAREIIDEELCIEEAANVAMAGCKCGFPTECPGICGPGKALINPDEQIILHHVGSSCSDFNGAAKLLIDPDLCEEYGRDARAAGCQCPGVYDELDEDGHFHGNSAGFQQSLFLSLVLLVVATQNFS